MKILEKSDKTLVIKSENSIKINLLCSGILLFLLFKHLVWLIVYSQAQVKLECVRSQSQQPKCELVQTTALGQQNIIKIDRLQLAIEKRQQPRNRLIGFTLKTNQGNLEINASYESSLTAIQQINEFIIKSNQPNLKIQFNYFGNNFLTFLVQAFFVTWLVVCWLIGPVETCTFDKMENSLLVKRQNLLGENILQFKLNEFEVSNLQTGITGYRLVLTIKNTQPIILSSSASKYNKELQSISNTINDFNAKN